MLSAHLTVSPILAYHDTQSAGGGDGILVLAVFVGVLATAGWVMFSRLRWRDTVLVAIGGWAVGLFVTFGL